MRLAESRTAFEVRLVILREAQRVHFGFDGLRVERTRVYIGFKGFRV